MNPPIQDMGESLPAIETRSKEIFVEHQNLNYRRTDRMFGGLLVFQYLASIIAALWISPRTWIGTDSLVHWHVWAAIFIGGAINSLPVWLAWKEPGEVQTRHAIAIAQMLTSGLLIHLTGGRIETHFHIFGSLAFLAFYRDWRVLMTATAIVAADHFARGVFWPQSIFGVLMASHWRWVEHAGWVVFEDVFLLLSIRQSLADMRLVAEREARLKGVNQGVEKLVEERTRELERTHKQLLEASRQAGMAEVATSVLHNVGNVLNSINVSASLIAECLKKSRSDGVAKISAMLEAHTADLGDFMTNDAKGRHLPTYIKQLSAQLAEEKIVNLVEVALLTKNIDHVKDIVAMQQNYARVLGVTETLNITELVEDALRMNASALTRHEVQFFRDYEAGLPEITVERHKVLQVLVNLIQNAKHACEESGAKSKQITARVTKHDARVQIALTDNGIGIPVENLARIFNHGFTTKKEGHGFGLHSGALAAKEMGGSLVAKSEGPGKGATFILELPCEFRLAAL